MNRKFFAILSALTLMAILISACAPAAPTQPAQEPTSEQPATEAPVAATEAPAAGAKKSVCLVQIDLSHPFHLGEVEGAKEAARRYDFELKVTSGEGDVNKQIQAFENCVNEGVDAISVNFIHFKAFGPAMETAKAAGIPVVCLHSTPDGCITTLGFDELYTGHEVGKYGVELLKQAPCWPDCQAANIQGLLGQGLNEARSGGWKEEMEAAGVKVVASEPTDWQPEKAVAAMENWLVAYPDLDIVYGNSDGLTVPAAEAARAAGNADLIFTSVDGSDFALEAIQHGLLKSTFMYAPEYSGFWKAWVPFKAAMGESIDPEILIKGALVNSDNVECALNLAKDQKEKRGDEYVTVYGQCRLHDADARLRPVLPEQAAVGRRDAGRAGASEQQDLRHTADRREMRRAVAAAAFRTEPALIPGGYVVCGEPAGGGHDHDVAHHQRRAGEAPARRLDARFGRGVTRPDDRAVAGVERVQDTSGPERVDATVTEGRRRARTDAALR